VTFAYRHGIQMSEDRFVQMKSALKDLVDRRNDLVHHLIEHFDLWSDEGRVRAAHHLQTSYTRIDGHFAELRQWGTSMDDARAMHASFMQTKVVEDFLINGIAPDGTIDCLPSTAARAGPMCFTRHECSSSNIESTPQGAR